jgi:hypothetical protein
MNEVYYSFRAYSPVLFQIYYLVVALTLMYILFKYRKDVTSILIILLFYGGLFVYLGKSVENLYKIFVLLFTVYISLRYNSLQNFDNKSFISIILFFVFSVFFLLSGLLNNNRFFLMFSQFSKYLIPFLFFFILKRQSKYEEWRLELISKLFLILITIQIGLSVLKYILFSSMEAIVGSISYIGGAAATVLPILGFIILWSSKKGRFKRNDWIFLIGLLFIGFASMKRAIWFILPIILLLFFNYVPKVKLRKKQFALIFIMLLLFYFGVRLNVTLNPDHKVLGRFDLDYTLNYASDYSYGKDHSGDRTLGKGRVGATLLLFTDFFEGNFEIRDLVGYGFDQIYTKTSKEFTKTSDFGVSAKGSLTGIYQGFISYGYLGTIVLVFFVISLISTIKERRIRNVLLGIFIWEYFFYTGIIFLAPSMSVMLIFLVFYLNSARAKGVF